jgi:hypothetical protein
MSVATGVVWSLEPEQLQPSDVWEASRQRRQSKYYREHRDADELDVTIHGFYLAGVYPALE